MLVIDPYLFFPDSANNVYNKDRVDEIKAHLKEVINICRRFDWKIVFDRIGWRHLEQTVIKNIADQSEDNELSVALRLLRTQFLRQVDLQNQRDIRTWGMKPLFNNFVNAEDIVLAEKVTKSLVHCLNHYPQVWLFVREIVGRNTRIHAAGNSFICERTRWRIYLSLQGRDGAVPVACISKMRNVSSEWTSRYDVGLPGSGTFAFTPPTDWHLRKTVAISVMQSKPVFIDREKNGWAKPNTPGAGYHWDVYLVDQKWRAATGLNQINICREDTPANQGVAGEIHHIPAAKLGRANC